MSDAPKPPPEGSSAPPAAEPPLSPGEAKLRAALAVPGLEEAFQQLEEIRNEPPPAAPDPIVVLPEKGGEVIIADVEAAVAYVEATAPSAAYVPRHTQTRVRVDARVDPRRQVTERKIRSEVVPAVHAAEGGARADAAGGDAGAAEGGASAVAAGGDAGAAGGDAGTASEETPSSRPPPPSSTSTAELSRGAGTRPRRGVLGAIFVGSGAAAIVLFLAMRPEGAPHGSDNGTGGEAPGAMTGAAQATTATATANGGGPVGTSMTSGSASATGTPGATAAMSMGTGAPATTGSAPSAPPATSRVKAPHRVDDPYLDAGAVPKATSAPSAEPTASVAPTAPSTTGSASVAPLATTVPGPSDTTFIIKPKGPSAP